MKTQAIAVLALMLGFALPAYSGSQLDQFQKVAGVSASEFCPHSSKVGRFDNTVAETKDRSRPARTNSDETLK